MRRNNIITIAALLFSAALLSSCSGTRGPYDEFKASNGAQAIAVGTMAGATSALFLGTPIPATVAFSGITAGAAAYHYGGKPTPLQKALNSGIAMYEVGQHVTFVIPADKAMAEGGLRVDARYKPVLNDLITHMRTQPKETVVVSGYTDDCGSARRNKAVSLQWATTIAEYLRQGKVGAAIIEPIGLGEKEPVTTNGNPLARKKNRRIEISYLRQPVHYYP